MKIVRRIIYWIIASGLVFGTFWYGYTRKSGETQTEEQKVPVEVEAVSTGSIQETIELTGWIKANHIVDVASKVAGRVESLQVISNDGDYIDVEEGVVIKKGRQLAVIDHDIFLAQLAAAQADVKAREVEYADAERERRRMVALFEGGSATEQNRDKTVTAAELAKSRLDLAKANLELAQISLRESTIISPIDGVVTVKHIDQGNLIRAGDRIVTIADIKTVKVIVAAAERYAEKIAAGTIVKIEVDALPDRVFEAKVYSIYPALDQQTHTVQVEIRLNNDQLLLKPGMFARVMLITKRKDNVVVIPRDIILGGKIDEPYVYVVNNSIAHKRIVEVGITEGASCEITDGLKLGEVLVVNGMNFLTDGIAVEVVRMEDIK